MFGHWYRCSGCNQMKFRNQPHTCPGAVVEKREAALDKEVAVEMSLFDEDLAKYLETNEAKFFEWQAERERE
jgi:hypothetical protein